MILLIGSRAAKAWFDDYREPNDWDAIAPLTTIMAWSLANTPSILNLIPVADYKYRCRLRDGTRIEFEVLDEHGSTGLLTKMSPRFKRTAFPGGDALAVAPELLWLIKRAHAIWSIHWQKTMEDLHWLRQRAPFADADAWAFHDLRRAEHIGRHGQRQINLAMSNDAFFAKSEKAIGRSVPHDAIHEIVKYGAQPLYEVFKNDPAKAILSRTLFEQASERDKQCLVREETMAIALERYVIPGIIEDGKAAYTRALQRICTTLTSGWFRDYAVDHWPDIRFPDRDFVSLWRAAAPHLIKDAA